MRIDVLTIFPSMFEPVLGESILKRAQKARKVGVKVYDIRDYTLDKHRKVDDKPYGGGCGMLMAPQPVFSCVDAVVKKAKISKAKRSIIVFSPRGKKLAQKDFKRFVRKKHLVLICGRYEGLDERVSKYLADEEVSIGDYVLTGGELPAMVFMDALIRLIPGVLGNPQSTKNESFESGLLEYPQYTRPSVFKGKKVPSVLLSGDHYKIDEWRRKESLKITQKRRPEFTRH